MSDAAPPDKRPGEARPAAPLMTLAGTIMMTLRMISNLPPSMRKEVYRHWSANEERLLRTMLDEVAATAHEDGYAEDQPSTGSAVVGPAATPHPVGPSPAGRRNSRGSSRRSAA